MNEKLIIVGGGFSGLFLGSLLRGNAIILEEHSRIGFPEHCAGIISPLTFKLLNIPSSLIESKFYYMNIHIGDSTVTWSGEPLALKLDRVNLESYLLDRCLKNGVDVKFKTRVLDLNENGAVVTDRGLFRSGLVILAEGSKRTFSRKIGLVKHCKDIIGLQARLKCKVYTEAIHVFPCAYSENFFSWLIPIKEVDEAVVGVGGRRKSHLKMYLKGLIKNLERIKLIDQSKIIRLFGGMIVRGPVGKLSKGRILGIGDAVQMSKPISGGGLYPIAVASKLLADKLNLYLDNRLNWFEVLNKYETDIKSLIKSLKYSHILSEFLFKYNCKFLRKILEGMIKLNLSHDLLGKIDYDEHFISLIRESLNLKYQLNMAGIMVLSLLKR